MANAGTYNHTKQHFAEGAAAATPDASEVVVYAKADGLMYSKDDAGTETLMSSGAGLSNPMTTAEDIIVGGASGTPARLAVGTEGQVLSVSSGAVAWAAATAGGLSTGTSFPGSPTTGDRYRRSDIDYLVFFFDGTRWVSEQLFNTEIQSAYTAAISTSTEPWLQPPHYLGYDMYVEAVSQSSFSGTAHSGTNYWTYQLTKQAGASTTVDVGSPIHTQDHPGGNGWDASTGAVNEVVAAADCDIFKVKITKVASGPNIIPTFRAYYRVIAT